MALDIDKSYDVLDVVVASTDDRIWWGKGSSALVQDWLYISRITNLGPDFVEYQMHTSTTPWKRLAPGESLVFDCMVAAMPSLRFRVYGIPSTIRIEGEM